MNHKTMQEEWRTYRDSIYKTELSAIQNRECHQAFYSGALVVFQKMLTASEQLSEQEAEVVITRMEREILEVCNLIAQRTKERSN